MYRLWWVPTRNYYVVHNDITTIQSRFQQFEPTDVCSASWDQLVQFHCYITEKYGHVQLPNLEFLWKMYQSTTNT